MSTENYRSDGFRAVALTAFLAGSLDICAAFLSAYLQAGSAPQRVLQSVASGALGKDAFEGGWTTAAAGLLLHFAIAAAWTAIYFYLFQKVSVLRINPLLSAILYGTLVWAFMNLVVIPLSAIGRFPDPSKPPMWIGLAIIWTCIGLPIALLAKRHFDARRDPS